MPAGTGFAERMSCTSCRVSHGQVGASSLQTGIESEGVSLRLAQALLEGGLAGETGLRPECVA